MGPFFALQLLALLGARQAEQPEEPIANDVERQKVHLGIDLGTTYSAAVMYFPDTGDVAPVIFDSSGKTVLPSTLYATSVTKDGKVLMTVGYQANDMNEKNPSAGSYFYGHKRLIGVADLSQHDGLDRILKEVTYKIEQQVTKDAKGNINKYYSIPVMVNNQKVADMTPTDFACRILQYILEVVRKRNVEPESVVITTPAYFDPNQDQETKMAAIGAGFKNVTISKEPVAACVAYIRQSNMKVDDEEKVLVFDFGGGTLDISVVDVGKEVDSDAKSGVISNVDVTGMAGDNFLGGENVNDELVKHFMKEVGQFKHLSSIECNMLHLRIFAEKFKIALCESKLAANDDEDVEYSDSIILNDESGKSSQRFTFSMKYSEFDRIVQPVYDRIHKLLFNSSTGLLRKEVGNVNSPPINPDSISKIILVGGSTKIPYIRTYLKQICPKAFLYCSIDVDMAVAHGACYICASDSGTNDVSVISVVPLPIGIAVANGLFQIIINKNAPIPVASEMDFTTVSNMQEKIDIQVASGVRPLFKDNINVGVFSLKLKKPMPAGVPKIRVSVEYHTDYSFTVTAKDMDTNETVSQVFTSEYGRPSRDKIDAILAEAKEFEEFDKDLKVKYEHISEIELNLKMLETQIDKNKLDVNAQADLASIVEGNRQWLTQFSASAPTSLVAEKLAALKADVEKFAKMLAESAKVPESANVPEGEPVPPADEVADEGRVPRDVL